LLVKGYLDDLELNQIKDFEKDFFAKINASSPDLIEKINTTGVLDDDAESKLKNAIEEFKKS
jgi:F-type H+-transporting ATPase subunit alpha